MSKYLILPLTIVTIFLLLPSNIFAHPGRTDSSGCHTCRTNCESWGLSYGEYHCHNGGGSAPIQPIIAPAPTTKPYVAPAKTTKTSTPKPTAPPTITPTESATNTPEVLSATTEETNATATPEVKVEGFLY